MSGIFYTGIEPRRMLYMLGVQNPCPYCLREAGELTFLVGEIDDEDLGRCWLHLSDLPSVLQEAMRETAKLPKELQRKHARGVPTTAEMEAANQWSAQLGRPVGPRQRIDALAHLIAEGKRTP